MIIPSQALLKQLQQKNSAQAGFQTPEQRAVALALKARANTGPWKAGGAPAPFVPPGLAGALRAGQAPDAPRNGNTEYSKMLSKQMSTNYKNLLSMRHKSATGGIKSRPAGITKVNAAKTPAYNLEGLHGKKGAEFMNTLKKIRKVQGKKLTSTVSAQHYDALRNYLIQKRKNAKLPYTPADIEEELMSLVMRMKDTKIAGVELETMDEDDMEADEPNTISTATGQLKVAPGQMTSALQAAFAKPPTVDLSKRPTFQLPSFSHLNKVSNGEPATVLDPAP